LNRQQNILKNLLTDNYTLWYDVNIRPAEMLTAPPPVLDLQDSWHKGMTQRPDLEQARLEMERQGYQLKYSFNQLFPQLDLVGSYGRQGQDPSSGNYDGLFSDIHRETSPFYSYGAVLTIPLGNKAAREQHKTVKAQQAQALLQLKKLEQDILVQIDDSIKTIRTSYERVGATKQAREYAEAALEAEEKKLANGRSTSFVVLQLQRDLTAARSAEVQALADYNKALAQLALFEGTMLEKHDIDFQIR
jgi:outer membrane protein TolC